MIWASRSPAHAAISGPIHGILGVESVSSWRPELPAGLAAFPRPPMPILIVGITQAQALMLDLASPPASNRDQGGIATYPLLTPRRLDQRRCGIAANPTRLAGNRRGFHPVVRPARPLFDGGRRRSALGSAPWGIPSWIIVCSGRLCSPSCPRHGWGPSGCALREVSCARVPQGNTAESSGKSKPHSTARESATRDESRHASPPSAIRFLAPARRHSPAGVRVRRRWTDAPCDPRSTSSTAPCHSFERPASACARSHVFGLCWLGPWAATRHRGRTLAALGGADAPSCASMRPVP